MNKRQRKKFLKRYFEKMGPILQAKANHDLFCSTPLFDYLMADDKKAALERRKKNHEECKKLLKLP